MTAQIGMANRSGEVFASNLPLPKGISILDRPHFQAQIDPAHDDLFISRPVIGRVSGQSTIQFSRKQLDPDGQFAGVAVVSLDCAELSRFYEALGIGDGFVSLISTDGTILAHGPIMAGQIGTRTPQSIAFGDMQNLATGASRRTGTSIGVERIISLRHLRDYPLTVVVGLSADTVFREYRSLRRNAVIIGIAITLAISGIGWFWLRQKQRGLTALAERDKAEMALRQHRDDLEFTVEHRTRALTTSEARYRDVAEVASDWFWETNEDLCLTFVSPRFSEMSGIPWEQMAGHGLAEMLGLGFDPAGMAELRATIDARRVFQNVVSRVVLSGGETRFWSMSGKPFTDAVSGAFAGYRGTGTDVTIKIERERALNAALLRAEEAEREARQAGTRLADAIEAIPEGFVLYDAEDRLVLCNTRYGEMYALTADDLEPGTKFEDILRATVARDTYALDGQDADSWLAWRLQGHRAIGGNRLEQRLGNGRWLQVEERRTSDGGTVGIRIDVTEAREREASERERAKLAALGQLAGGVAHEINNLLQPGLSLPEMVIDRLPPDDTESRESLECIVDSARKMREIVRDVLLFARNEQPRLSPFDLVTEIRAALRFVGGLIAPTVSVREVDLEAHLGRQVAVNKTQLTQVLTNLVVNAAQATTGTGSVSISVARTDPTPEAAATLGIEAGRAYLAVSVTDTGSGMDQATQARIFDPFFTTKPIGQGTGLGLSVVYGILRSWQGAITVRSALGEGTTFVLYIPEITTGATQADRSDLEGEVHVASVSGGTN
jgi:PAS domain S-box-containing protein